MDLGDLLLLLFLLAPLIKRFFDKNKSPRPKAPAGTREERPGEPVSPSGDGSEAEDSLSEALRQIRVALGDPTVESSPPADPTPQPKPTSKVERRPKPGRSLPRPDPRPEPEFRQLGAYEHEEHGFGMSNPLSEEAFEQLPAFQSRREVSPPTPKRIARADLSSPLKVRDLSQERADAKTTSFANRLRDPDQARDAFISGEILGPPRSKKRSPRS